MELFTTLHKCPLIAILHEFTPQKELAVEQGLIGNGFTVREVPMNSPEEPLASIALLLEAFGERALIGAGAITELDQVHAVAQMGGQLIMTPHVKSALIHVSKEEGLYCIPGFSTPTEAYTALE